MKTVSSSKIKIEMRKMKESMKTSIIQTLMTALTNYSHILSIITILKLRNHYSRNYVLAARSTLGLEIHAKCGER